MAKPELGTKRLCGNCGAKFYDLTKTPIVCPKCETVFQVVVPMTRGRPDAAALAAAAAARAPAAVAEVEAPETQDAEFVSLEDADAEATGSKKVDADAVDADDVEIEADDDEALDDSTLIEETEEGDDDVADIIGDGREDEEET